MNENVVKIRVVFPAIIEIDQFDSQIIKLGGIYPEIEIKLLDKATGLHEFVIPKTLPHNHPSILNPTVAEAEDQISYFWDILSFIRNTVIHPTGEIYYVFNDTRIEFAKRHSIIKGSRLIGVAGDKWFEINKKEFHKNFNLDLLKRYNYSLSITEPIGKFISLYSLLLSIAKDSQFQLDKLIETVDSNVAKYIPKGRRTETIYTRLRNELSHIREGSSIMKTHSEIVLHLPRFEWIIKEILRKQILIK